MGENGNMKTILHIEFEPVEGKEDTATITLAGDERGLVGCLLGMLNSNSKFLHIFIEAMRLHDMVVHAKELKDAEIKNQDPQDNLKIN